MSHLDSRLDRFSLPPAVASTPSGTAVIDLREIASVFARRRFWLIVPALLALLGGIAFALLSTPAYVAATQILIDPRGLQVVENGLSPSNNQVSEASLVVVESQMGVISSEGVLRKVVEEQNLGADSDFAGRRSILAPIGDAVRGVLGIERQAEDPELRALRELQRKTTVRRGEKSYVVDIAVETDDRFKSARIANAIADVYLRNEFESRQEATQKASRSLSGRLDELRERVRVAEEKAETYKAQKNIVGASGRLVSDQQLTDLNTQVGAAQAKASELRARAEQIEQLQKSGAEPDSIAESVQSGLIAQLRVQYAEVRRRQADITAHLGSRHPDVIQMEAQIRSQRVLINQELARIARSTRSDYERARAAAASLTQNLDRMKGQATNVSRELVRLRELEREVDSSRKIYDAFSKRAKEVGEQQAIDTTTTRRISEAIPPNVPKGFGFAATVLSALVGGLCLGAAGGFLRDQLAGSIHSKRQIAAAIDLPILASIPGAARRGRHARSISAGLAGRFPLPELDGSSILALRHLDRRIAPGPNRRTLSVVITSPSPTASVSAATLGWAQAAVLEGRRTLIIDARTDLPRSSRDREATQAAGLAEVLSGRDRLDAVVCRDPEAAVSWLELGDIKQSLTPSTSVLKQTVLAQIADYDLVLIDVGSVHNDVSISSWAEAVDVIVVAVEENTTDLGDAEASVDALRVFDAKVKGLIFVRSA